MPGRKLAYEMVETIKREYQRGTGLYSQVSLGKKYGLSGTCIGRIVNGQSYLTRSKRPKLTEVHKRILSETSKGKPHPSYRSEETKRRWTELLKTQKEHPTFKGKHHSTESKLKLSIARRGKSHIVTEEGRQHMREAQRKHLLNPTYVNALKKRALENLKCVPQISTKIERFVASWLMEVQIGFIPQFPIEGKRYDFGIPEKNLLVECDGEYWHSQPHALVNDPIKNDIAERHGWTLLRLPEADFKTSLARQKLFTALGVSTSQ